MGHIQSCPKFLHSKIHLLVTLRSFELSWRWLCVNNLIDTQKKTPNELKNPSVGNSHACQQAFKRAFTLGSRFQHCFGMLNRFSCLRCTIIGPRVLMIWVYVILMYPMHSSKYTSIVNFQHFHI